MLPLLDYEAAAVLSERRRDGSHSANPGSRDGSDQMPLGVPTADPVGVSVEVRPCTVEDIEGLRRGDWRPRDMRHHEERWESQQRQEAVYLLAWRGAEVVGSVTLLLRSKYEVVRRVIEDAAEMNALEARPQGQGIGTAMIQAAELQGARRGSPIYTGVLQRRSIQSPRAIGTCSQRQLGDGDRSTFDSGRRGPGRRRHAPDYIRVRLGIKRSSCCEWISCRPARRRRCRRRRVLPMTRRCRARRLLGARDGS